MSEENKALMARFWEEGFNQGNMATVDELWSADGVNHAAPPGTPPGPEGVKQLVTKLLASFPGSRLTIEDTIAEGDKVVTRTTYRGTHQSDFLWGVPATGKEFEQTQIHIVRIAGGQIVEHWATRDDLGVVRRLGAAPASG